MKRTAVACAIACLGFCAQHSEASGVLRAVRSADREPHPALLEAERIGLALEASAETHGGSCELRGGG